MRRMAVLWLFLAALSGGTLYHTSQEVTDGRARLATLNDDVAKEDESIRVLQAEWSYLNQPARLEKLSGQYLHLAPMNGRQFAALKDIPEQPAAPVADAAPAAAPAKTAAVAAAAPPVAKPVIRPLPKPESRAEAAAKASVVKLRKPAPARLAPPVATAETAPERSFGDVMKSLGVR